MMIAERKDASQQKEEVQGNDAKPGKLLRCPQEGCGKVFRSSPGYRYHLKSHDIDPRPHVCQCCHKKFKSANGLKYHLRKAHNIEPVLSKQNLRATSPKGRESISSEEDPYISLTDSYPRTFMNGAFRERTSVPSPLIKSPLPLTSPLLKNLPGIPSPLIKSPMDMGSYMSGGSASSGLQSPYTMKDRFSHYDKISDDSLARNGEYSRRPTTSYNRLPGNSYSSYCSRSSLSEYTQQCQQANNQFRQQCQRLSTGDLSNPRLPSADYDSQRSSCEFYNCHKADNYQHSTSGSFSSDYHSDSRNEAFNFSCITDDKNFRDSKPYNGFKDFPLPNEGKEYPNDLVNRDLQCTTSHDKLSYNSRSSFSSCNGGIKEEPVFLTKTPTESVKFKIPSSVQNTEQIVPDISTSPSNIQCDRNNNTTPKNLRGASESSTETELSDCVFQNDISNPPISPSVSKSIEMVTLSSTVVKKEDIDLACTVSKEALSVSSNDSNTHQDSKPLLSRRTSRSKSIPQVLVINPTPMENEIKPKDLSKLDPTSRLRHLAEIATSPRSPFRHSPLPLSLTPSLLPDSSHDWTLKSPSRYAFPDKTFLLTPTISRSNADTSHSDSIITSSNSLPPSPFLDNIQTPSFWPTQMWPTPVWLCFLRGCSVKFEQDDKEFMTTEDVAAFCTTPGGRRRDDMNFYTSGMKIVEIREKPSRNSAREMIELTFEQIIPGTQRLVAKCPIDHPFYTRQKGWSASNPTEAMARYGIPFRALNVNDTVVQAPMSKMNQITGNSPALTSAKGPQVFTFSVQDTSKFSQARKIPESPCKFSPPKLSPVLKETTSSSSPPKTQETITLTYSAKSTDVSKSSKQPTSQQKLVNELKSISEAMKNRAMSMEEVKAASNNLPPPNDSLMSEDVSKKCVAPRKKRRKPLLGNEKDRRPMNGFMLFAKSMRVELTKVYPGKDNRAISKLLGERWRELCEEKREDFSRMAKEMADERMKVNPDCWKRKHRKEKDTGSKSSSGDGESPDCKKAKISNFGKDDMVPTFMDASSIATSDGESKS